MRKIKVVHHAGKPDVLPEKIISIGVLMINTNKRAARKKTGNGLISVSMFIWSYEIRASKNLWPLSSQRLRPGSDNEQDNKKNPAYGLHGLRRRNSIRVTTGSSLILRCSALSRDILS